MEHELVKYTPQWLWLRNELKQVDRERTPWLIVIMHAPIYNSNKAHYMEGESIRAVFENWFVRYKVDLVFAGHVHAYERSVFLLFLSANMIASYKYWYLNFINHILALKNQFSMPQFWLLHLIWFPWDLFCWWFHSLQALYVFRINNWINL